MDKEDDNNTTITETGANNVNAEDESNTSSTETGANNVNTEDEKMLESEVNDLLDQFIDSLDNYDK